MSEKPLSQEEIITQYAAGIEQLDTALKGLSPSDLDLSREKGKWTIRQILHHIADAEDLWKISIKAALGNSGCNYDISWYVVDNKCAGPLDYAHRPVDQAVELFKVTRRHVVELVTHLPNALERYIHIIGVDWAEAKKYTVRDIMEWQIQHLLLHLEQIRITRHVHGVS